MISPILSKKLTGVICYITIVGWLIAFLLGDVKGGKFHLNQALVLGIAEFILSLLASLLGFIFLLGIVFWVLDLVFFIFAILGIIGAIKGEENPLPLIGGIKIL